MRRDSKTRVGAEEVVFRVRDDTTHQFLSMAVSVPDGGGIVYQHVNKNEHTEKEGRGVLS